MVQTELDYVGQSYALNAKLINADPVTGFGVLTASYLQSVTCRIALGAEVVLHRMQHPLRRSLTISDVGCSFVGKWFLDGNTFKANESTTEGNNGKAEDASGVPVGGGLLTVSVQPSAAIQASYWHRVSPKIELAAEWQSVFSSQNQRGEMPSAGLAARFDFKQAQIRAALDTTGKVSCVYEERVFPGFSLLLSGEIDHAEGWGPAPSGPSLPASRWGFGVSLEN